MEFAVDGVNVLELTDRCTLKLHALVGEACARGQAGCVIAGLVSVDDWRTQAKKCGEFLGVEVDALLLWHHAFGRKIALYPASFVKDGEAFLVMDYRQSYSAPKEEG